MDRPIIKGILLVIYIVFCLPLITHAQTAEVSNGLTWLKAAQNPDGSWGARNTLRDTSAVIDTFKLLGESSSSYLTAMAWINSTPQESHDYIARRLVSLNDGGTDINADLQELLVSQNLDGGWGYAAGFKSNVYDTAIVLRAFWEVQFPAPNSTTKGVNYLLSQQNSDGSWSILRDVPGDIATTSLAVTMLKKYGSSNVFNDAIDKGVAWLKSHQNPDGGFGDSPSSLQATAFAIAALLETGQVQADSLQSAVGYVTANQFPDGSWNGSAYETASALKLFAKLKSNPSIVTSDMTVSNANPKSGEIVNINAIVRNTGSDTAQNIPVQIIVKTPDQQLILLGSQTIPNLPVGGAATVEAGMDTRGREGIYEIIVKIDPDNILDELSKEDNQAAVQLSITPIPDLMISNGDMVVSKNPAGLGEDLTVTAKVTNQGNYLASNVEIVFYHDSVSPDNVIGSSIIGLLDAGASASRDIIWKADKTGSAAVPLLAVVDPNNRIAELTKANNQAVTLVEINTLTGMNLSVSYKDISFASVIAKQGGALDISAVVRNEGTIQADLVEVAFFKGDPASGGSLIGTNTIQSLAVGASATVSVNWSNIADSGERVIYVKVDPSNSVQELTKDDNIAFKAINILSIPDLVVTTKSIAINPPTPKEGDDVTIGVTVRNAGNQEAGNFKVAVSEGNTPVGSQTIAVLSGDSAQTLSFSYATTGKTGMHEITVLLDPDNTVSESNESNNKANRSFGVNNANTWLTEEYISPNGDGIKESTTFSFRLDIAQTVSIAVVNQKDETVRTFSGGEFENSIGGSAIWDGLDESGKVVEDGQYRMQVKGPDGNTLKEARVVVDTNNSSLIEALTSGNLLYDNLMCKMPSDAFYCCSMSGDSYYYNFQQTATWMSDGGGLLYSVLPNYSSPVTFGPNAGDLLPINWAV